MENGPARAKFWMEFLATKCGYPAPERLRAQLDKAEFTEFCYCGCNSFGVKVTADVLPLFEPKSPSDSGGSGAIFMADFKINDSETLEFIIFANNSGNLDYIEVDYCANSAPVPETIVVPSLPYNIWVAEGLLR
jgi:hypothetical protein